MLLAPLVGALLAGFGARAIGDLAAQWCATGLLLCAAALAWILLSSGAGSIDPNVLVLSRWIESGTFVADVALRVDLFSLAMAALVTSFGAIVSLYSFGRTAPKGMFKKNESYRPRLMAHESLLVFGLLLLVLAETLPLMFAGWVASGLAAYALVGFHYRRLSSGWAAMRVFVYQRVGDLGLLSAFGAFYLWADTAEISVLLGSLENISDAEPLLLLGMSVPFAEFAAFALLFAASTVLAQVGLHVWLVKGTEAPAPSLALLHTVYAAGGLYILVRFGAVIDAAPKVQTILIVWGAATALFGATVGFVQSDARRLISMVCLAEMGLIMLALGAGLRIAALMHLALYGLSAVLLFHVVGWLGQAMRHDYDMRHHGGLKTPMRGTFWLAILAALAFTGLGTSFGYAGQPAGFGVFLSEAYILAELEALWRGLPWLLLFALFLVSLALWRMVFMSFTGMARGDRDSHEVAVDPPRWLWMQMFSLALLALVSGLLLVGPLLGTGKLAMSPLPGLACISGLFVAWVFYNLRPAWPGALAGSMAGGQEFLREGWFLEKGITQGITGPTVRAAQWASTRVEGNGLDRLLSALAARSMPGLERATARLQSRPAWRVVTALLVVALVILIWVLWAG
ncbi:MAG: proton-conducting transporter membrane subunit [Pseudomonadota bacterium]